MSITLDHLAAYWCLNVRICTLMSVISFQYLPVLVSGALAYTLLPYHATHSLPRDLCGYGAALSLFIATLSVV